MSTQQSDDMAKVLQAARKHPGIGVLFIRDGKYMAGCWYEGPCTEDEYLNPNPTYKQERIAE